MSDIERADVDAQHEEEIEDVDDSYIDSEVEAKETEEASGTPKYGCSHYECRCAYIVRHLIFY